MKERTNNQHDYYAIWADAMLALYIRINKTKEKRGL